MTQFVVCQNCLLPARIQGVILDEHGVCNYCRYHKENNVAMLDPARGRVLFERRIARIRGKYDYDAFVGVSGGKDGAYVLYRLAVEKKLKVLAFTLDNEFFSAEGREKVKELVQKASVDHVWLRRQNFAPLYEWMLHATGIPCFACGMGGYYSFYKELFERRIPLFVHGRSPYQILRNIDWSTAETDVFALLQRSNYEDYSADAVRAAYRLSYQRISKLLSIAPLAAEKQAAIQAEFFLSPEAIEQSDFVPEMFAYFLTEEYDEDFMRSVLREKLDYEAPSTHADCVIHNFADFSWAHMRGASLSLLETCAMLRWGRISRAQAEATLEEIGRGHASSGVLREEYRVLCSRLGLEPNVIGEAMHLPSSIMG